MTTSDDFVSAYILHVRPYQETSALVETFCREQGRVAMVFRRVRGGKSSKAGFLQPFQPLWISYSGQHELRSGRQLEARGAAVWLTGTRLFSGFYLNELLMRLLHRDDPHPTLFDCYETALNALQSEDIEPALRRFERRLLTELGYEIPLAGDQSGSAFDPDTYYFFAPEHGFYPVPESFPARQTEGFSGRSLINIAADDYSVNGVSANAVRRDAKRLFRLALQPHLGDKPLMSRALFNAGRTRDT